MLLKVKVTGRLHEDGQWEFLDRLIKLDGNNIALGVKPEYVRSVFTAFGWTEKDLEKVKPSATTPDIRSIYDEEDPENPSKPLTQEAAGRYWSCLGKIGWLTQTRNYICVSSVLIPSCCSHAALSAQAEQAASSFSVLCFSKPTLSSFISHSWVLSCRACFPRQAPHCGPFWSDWPLQLVTATFPWLVRVSSLYALALLLDAMLVAWTFHQTP